jgi:hypothetical protein
MFRRRTMLSVNIGLSRKLSKDYNSTGYSVNLDGEVTRLGERTVHGGTAIPAIQGHLYRLDHFPGYASFPEPFGA